MNTHEAIDGEIEIRHQGKSKQRSARNEPRTSGLSG
jgi:hypothetical protein